MMKILCLLLVLVSCGKNAFISKRLRSISAVEAKNIHLLRVSPNILDFGELELNSKKTLNFKVENIGDLPVSRLKFDFDNSYYTVTQNCLFPLLHNEFCNVDVEFQGSDSELESSSIIQVSHPRNDKKYSIDLKFKTVIVPSNDHQNTLSLQYTYKKGIFDFGRVFRGSTHNRLLYLFATGNEGVKIITRVASLKGMSISSHQGIQECNEKFRGGCFLNVNWIVKEKGSVKGKILIEYIDLGSNKLKSLVIPVHAKSYKSRECFEFIQNAHLATTKQPTDYESSLQYPYQFIGATKLAEVYRDDWVKSNPRHNVNTQVRMSYRIDRGGGDIFSAKLLLNTLKKKGDVQTLCNLDFQLCSGLFSKKLESQRNKKFKVTESTFNSFFQSDNIFSKSKNVLLISGRFGLNESKLERQLKKHSSLNFSIAGDIKLEENPVMIITRRTAAKCI